MIMAETIFSKIIRREIPADIVFEDDEVLAFRDISPKAPTHVLIIPKTPIATTNDIAAEQEQLVGHMVTTAARIARDLGIAESGYRLVFNCNEDGGQEVFHIHLHLLGGRPLGWPPG
jgi:histidine triad (HIT) family protein